MVRLGSGGTDWKATSNRNPVGKKRGGSLLIWQVHYLEISDWFRLVLIRTCGAVIRPPRTGQILRKLCSSYHLACTSLVCPAAQQVLQLYLISFKLLLPIFYAWHSKAWHSSTTTFLSSARYHNFKKFLFLKMTISNASQDTEENQHFSTSAFSPVFPARKLYENSAFIGCTLFSQIPVFGLWSFHPLNPSTFL